MVNNLIKTGYIYILTNSAYKKNFLKIGMTTRTPEKRANEISSSTGVPEKFRVAYKRIVPDCRKAEKLIHNKLDKFRNSNNREFFVLPLEKAEKIINDICNELENIQLDKSHNVVPCVKYEQIDTQVKKNNSKKKDNRIYYAFFIISIILLSEDGAISYLWTFLFFIIPIYLLYVIVSRVKYKQIYTQVKKSNNQKKDNRIYYIFFMIIISITMILLGEDGAISYLGAFLFFIMPIYLLYVIAYRIKKVIKRKFNS